MPTRKKILLIDADDLRRMTRVRMLEQAGYEIDVNEDHLAVERLAQEASYDLVVLALHRRPEDASSYSERLRKRHPTLPVLLVTDAGVFVPRGTLSANLETGYPREMMEQIASMLAGSTHVRELRSDPSSASD